MANDKVDILTDLAPKKGAKSKGKPKKEAPKVQPKEKTQTKWESVRPPDYEQRQAEWLQLTNDRLFTDNMGA